MDSKGGHSAQLKTGVLMLFEGDYGIGLQI
jgi:hypothetical protein